MFKFKVSEILDICNGKLINTREDFTIENISINSNEINENDLFIPIIGNRYDAHDFVNDALSKAKIALFQSDHDYSKINKALILVEDTKLALGELAKAYLKKVRPTVIGITGSNGKTSTKDILFCLARRYNKTHATNGNQNNEIGLPLTILSMPMDTELLILEMGMSALGDLDYLGSIAKMDLAIITSIGSAHLADLGSYENIYKAKLEIAKHLKVGGRLLVNGDNSEFLNSLRKLKLECPIKTFGFNKANNYHTKVLKTNPLIFEFTKIITTNLIGEFQALNCIAAIIALDSLKIKFNLEDLNNIELTKNRNEISIIKKAIVIDDSYKSNPESLAHALKILSSYSQKSIAVLGDMYDLGDDSKQFHSEIGKLIKALAIDHLFTLGDHARYFHEDDVDGKHFNNADELLKEIIPFLDENCVILFKASNALKFYDIVDKLGEYR